MAPPRARKSAAPAPPPSPAPPAPAAAAPSAAAPLAPGMQRLELPSRRASLGGRVTDAVTGLPLPGARVEIVGAPEAFTTWAAIRARQLASQTPPGPAPGLAASGADGWFRFLDLPPGTYALAVSLPAMGSRYAAGTVSATVSAEVTGGRGWSDASVALRPTVIAGRVTGPDGDPVALAEVRLKGSLEAAVTDLRGEYRLVAVEAGARELLASARGVGTARVAVALALPGDAAEADLELRAG